MGAASLSVLRFAAKGRLAPPGSKGLERTTGDAGRGDNDIALSTGLTLPTAGRPGRVRKGLMEDEGSAMCSPLSRTCRNATPIPRLFPTMDTQKGISVGCVGFPR